MKSELVQWVKMKKYKILIIQISAILCGVFSTLLWVYFAKVMENVVDNILNHNFGSFYALAIMFIFYIFITRCFSLLSNYLKVIYVNKASEKLRNDYLVSQYKKRNIEDVSLIMSRINNDISQVKEFYFSNKIDFITDIISFIFSSYLLLKINVFITFILYILTFFIILIPIFAKKHIQKLQLDLSLKNSIMTNKIKDDFSGFNIIKDYNIEEYCQSENTYINGDLTKSFMKFENVNYLFMEISHFFITTVGSIGFLVGSYFVMQGDISYGNMIAIVQLTNTLVSPINSITRNISKMIGGKALYDLILKEINNTVNNVVYHKNKISTPINDIKFDNVKFIVNNQTILNNINLTLEKDKKYLILGKTGSGKSSLLKLIFNYYPDYQGQILINNTDVRILDKPLLSTYITYIEQFPHLFKKSIYENVSLYRNISKTKIAKVIAKLHLDQLIDKQQDKLDTIIDTEKLKISGGEQQRIALCRALADNKNICMFDEVTSALDMQTARIAENEILSLNCDILIRVAHVLDAEDMKKYDQIIVMKQGTISFVGSYDELMKIQVNKEI